MSIATTSLKDSMRVSTAMLKATVSTMGKASALRAVFATAQLLAPGEQERGPYKVHEQ